MPIRRIAVPFARRLGLPFSIGAGGKRKYVLYDQFITARSAGAVNGTASELGNKRLANAAPTRTVKDTESKLSIASGALTFAGGKASPGWGDPGLWYPSVTRIAGRMFLASISPTNTSTEIGLGFNNAASSQPSSAAINFASSSRIMALGSLTVGAYTTNTYSLCIVLRATGAFYFIKGGVFSTWELLHVGATNAVSPLYPAVVSYNSPQSVDNIRIPATLWLPVPLASDSFTRANGALGNTDGLGHAEQNGGSGKAWTGATWTISSNKAVNTPTGTEKLTDTSLEANYTAGLCDTLTKSGSPTVSQSADAHSGSKSQSFTPTAINDNLRWSSFTPTAGKWYHASFWCKAATSGGASYFRFNGSWGSKYSSEITATSYTQYRAIARAASTTALSLNLYHGGTGGFVALTLDDGSLLELDTATLFSSLSLSTPDVMIDAKVSALTAGTQAGIVARLDSSSSPANFIIAYFDGAGKVIVEECVSGTYADVSAGGYTKAFSADDTLRLDLSGTAFRLYHITSAGVVSLLGSGSTNVTTGNLHGQFSTYASNTFGGFLVWPKGTGGEHNAIGGM